MIATLDGFEIEWDAGMIRVRPDLVAELDALDRRDVIAGAGLAAACLKLQADVERRMSEPAYDRDAFEDDDRPFRVAPGSAHHARLVFAAMGAEIEIDFEDDDDDLRPLEAELEADLAEFGP